MAETIEKVEQAENTKVESTDNPIDDKHEQTESVSIADKNEFLQNFIKDNDDNDTQSIEEAKIKDKISMLEAKIKDIKATKSSQNDTIQACKTVIDSNTYPKLNPIISSFSAHLEKLDKKKDKKIEKKENQLRKEIAPKNKSPIGGFFFLQKMAIIKEIFTISALTLNSRCGIIIV